MSFGVMVWDGAGNVVYDSSVAVGGVIADIRTFGAGETAVLTYPAFAGRSVEIIPILSGRFASTYGVATDTALGYPRVTVSTAGTSRRFAVEVY